MINKIFAVGIGGFLGSVFRYLITIAAVKITNLMGFPIGTLLVNVLGSFLIGLCFEILIIRADGISKVLELFLFVGILGGFTTFSAFSKETHILFTEGKILLGYCNILANLTLCIMAVYLGHIAGGVIK